MLANVYKYLPIVFYRISNPLVGGSNPLGHTKKKLRTIKVLGFCYVLEKVDIKTV